MAKKKKTKGRRRKKKEGEKSRIVTPNKEIIMPGDFFIKGSFIGIERIYAEDGMVKTLQKDGRTTAFSPQQAAQRAQELNKMDVPAWHLKTHQELLERIIAACREAKSQLEDPNNERAMLVKNVLSGKTAEGKPLTEVVTEEDKRVADFKKQYSLLTAQDIRIVINDKSLDEDRQAEMMKTVNDFRKAEGPEAGIPSL